MAEYRYVIEKIIDTPEYGDFCRQCIAEENPRALLKLIQVLSRKHGKGTMESDLFVLKITMDYYSTEDNIHIFEGVAKIVDGESTA